MNLKTTLALLGVLALLLVAWLLTRDSADKDRGYREREKMVPGFEAERVTRIRIENAERNDKVVLAKKGDDWQMEEPLRVAADGVQARFIADYFANYEGTRVGAAGHGGAKLEALGLDKPRAIVEIEWKGADDGAPARVAKARIGSDNLKGTNVFLQVGDVVYDAPRTLYNSIAKPSSEFRDRRVFTFSSYDVNQAEFGRAEGTVVIKAEEGEWRILAPFKGRADTAAAVKVQGLANVRVMEFVDDTPKDLAPYGLLQPERTVTLRTAKASQTLRIGKVVEERVLVQREGESQVWAIASSDLECVRRSAEDLRDPSIFGNFAADAVKSLHWRLGTVEVEFTQDPASRKVRLVKPREAEVEREAFDGVLKALAGLKSDSLVSSSGANLADFGLAPPHGLLEIQLKDAAKATRVELGATRPEGAFLRREGDDYLLRVPPAALASIAKAPTDFVSRELARVDSYDPGQVEIDLVRPGSEAGTAPKRLVFKRNEANKWSLAGSTDESKPFAELTDSLWHARATEILAVDPKDTALASPSVEVRTYRRLFGDPTGDDKEKERIATYRFARDAAGAWFGLGLTGAVKEGGFAARVAEELPMRLLSLGFPGEFAPASKPASGPAGEGAASAPTSIPASSPRGTVDK